MAAVLLIATGAVLALIGAPTGAVAAVAGGVVAGIPAGLSAAAKPRPGLVWQGRYAEPWRAEPSPGDLSHAVNVEADGATRGIVGGRASD